MNDSVSEAIRDLYKAMDKIEKQQNWNSLAITLVGLVLVGLAIAGHFE